MKRIVKKPFERKAEIIATARGLFLKDYEKATIQDVINLLGIAKGTIYHYFKSKEELLEAVVKDIVDQYIEGMKKRILKTKGNALKKIQALVEEGQRLTEPGVVEHIHKKGNEAMHTRLLVATLMQQAPLYAKLIQQGCKEGIFQTKYPLECAEFILSGIQFLTDSGISPWTKKELGRRKQAFPSLIEQLLQAPPNSFQFMNRT